MDNSIVLSVVHSKMKQIKNFNVKNQEEEPDYVQEDPGQEAIAYALPTIHFRNAEFEITVSAKTIDEAAGGFDYVLTKLKIIRLKKKKLDNNYIG